MPASPSLHARCPTTGRDVYPDISITRASGASIIVCPNCSGKHLWVPEAAGFAAQLLDIIQQVWEDVADGDGEEEHGRA